MIIQVVKCRLKKAPSPGQMATLSYGNLLISCPIYDFDDKGFIYCYLPESISSNHIEFYSLTSSLWSVDEWGLNYVIFLESAFFSIFYWAKTMKAQFKGYAIIEINEDLVNKKIVNITPSQYLDRSCHFPISYIAGIKELEELGIATRVIFKNHPGCFESIQEVKLVLKEMNYKIFD